MQRIPVFFFFFPHFKRKYIYFKRKVKQALSDDTPPLLFPSSSSLLNPPPPTPLLWEFRGLLRLGHSLLSVLFLPGLGSLGGDGGLFMARLPHLKTKHRFKNEEEEEEGGMLNIPADGCRVRRTNWQIRWMYTNAIYIELELVSLRRRCANSNLCATCFVMVFFLLFF